MNGKILAVGTILALLAFAGGCATVRVTDPARTATEQFLLSQAAARAVAQLSADPLRGRKIYINSEYFAASEQAFVLGELRAQLLLAGVQLVPERKDAQIVLEVRSGGVGIDRYEYLLGLPSFYLPQTSGVSGGTSSVVSSVLATPELALYKNTRQYGIASVAFVAYWADTGEVVASSPPLIGRSLREDYWILGTGPRTVGDIPPTQRPK